MADIVLNGYILDKKSIPGSILAIDQPITSIQCYNGSIVVKEKSKAFVLPRTNLHVMSKAYLQTENFTNFVNNIVNES